MLRAYCTALYSADQFPSVQNHEMFTQEIRKQEILSSNGYVTTLLKWKFATISCKK